MRTSASAFFCIVATLGIAACGSSSDGSTLLDPGPAQGAPIQDAGTAADASGGKGGEDGAPAVDAGKPAPPSTDDSQLAGDTFPDTLGCLAPRAAALTLKNTGTTTWTRAAGYELDAVGGSDPLVTSARVALGDTESIAPGATKVFDLPLSGPLTVGQTYKTQWRMAKGGAPFGAIASHSVGITCSGEDALAGAVIENSPADIASWPVTTKITQVTFTPDGLSIAFDKRDGANRWPDITPPGWDGPIYYTIWVMMNVQGKWYASGIIQVWYDLPAAGGDVTANQQVAKNWVYDGRWGPLAGHQPAPGEAVGFMVVSGNERGVTDASQSVRERSDMVVVAFPTAAGAVVSF